ncbi:MAG TPA: hypothetical protein VGM53_00210 [Streptosporangiaceae bacterium]
MLTRWYGGFAAAAVTLGTITLVVLELTDTGFRHWWAARPLTTDTAAGVLVVLVTVLVVNQVVTRRQVSDRSRAIAAQAAIVMAQAMRSAQTVTAALAGTGDRDTATDEVRTYMIMLLVGAPVLIDTPVSRDFLEQAQHLGGEMARVAGLIGKTSGAREDSQARIDRSVARLRAASAPLLQLIDFKELTVADPGGPATP